MLDPDALLDTLVTALKAIPDLITALEANPSNIAAYHLNYAAGSSNMEQAKIEQRAGTLLVFWTGTRTGNFNKMESIKHDFLVSCKPRSKVGVIFQALREGVLTSTGLKFKLSCIDLAVHPPESIQIRNQTIFISDRYGLIDFTDILFTLTERGIDN